MAATVVRAGQVCSASAEGRLDIRIEDGRIAAVAPHLPAEAGDHVIDASGMLVLPGLIDCHVHFRDPGSPERESFPTGTAAAASNGVTTVLEMPTSDVPVTTAERIEKRGRHLTGRSFVDFGLYAGAGRGSLDDVAGCASAGAVAFKTFTHSPTAARAAAFEGLWAVNQPDLLCTLQAVAATGRVHALHCEDDSLLEYFASKDDASAPFGVRHRNSRPPVVEQSAVAAVTALALETRSRIHLVHVSTNHAVDIACAARDIGVDLSIETCGHYLTLDDRTLDRFGSHAKCNPPLRPADTREALVRAVRDGRIDIIASDHCSYTPDEIAKHSDDPQHALPGLPGIEFLLPTLMHLVTAGGIPMRQAVACLTSAPARRFGLKGKGDIAVGYDADLVVVAPDAPAPFSLSADYHASGSKNAVYLQGVDLRGRAMTTLVRGVPVVAGGELVGSPDHGKWIRAE
ncbi:allantoinase [Dactylosporangium fulvum]|uniref:Dihydroorotase family protein n=1 Tax=Dactylosporangium fulvum TaxID=53359 RepID=A0ABY5VV86_9ACTN|nr:dihydroorotase family protein [Dactylosporangium fulvum]UWP80398.1 dihydroorotase family protein [Dactylosporangium fulvum]